MPRLSPRGSRPTVPGHRRESERGQMLVIFAIALVALLGMVGLIIDGSDTFLQRRDQQNVADAAAMAAGYASLNGQSPQTTAQTIATSNGYVHGQGGTTVTVTVGTGTITVDVTRPHTNYFSGVMGFSSWNVSTTATVEIGTPNAALGAMPLIFNKKAFDRAANKNEGSSAWFDEPGSGNQDVPQTDTTFNWTVFCTANGNPCNANSNDVRDLIDNEGTSTTVRLNDLIGPLNAGAHTTLFNALAAQVGKPYPVAFVNDAGAMVGWAYFHLTGSVGGSTKQIAGWFDDQVNAPPMFIIQGGGTADSVYGALSVKLID